jgi:hypothetical protein
MPPPPQLYQRSSAPSDAPPPASIAPSSRPATAGSAGASTPTAAANSNPEAAADFDPRFSRGGMMFFKVAQLMEGIVRGKGAVMTADEFLAKYPSARN